MGFCLSKLARTGAMAVAVLGLALTAPMNSTARAADAPKEAGGEAKLPDPTTAASNPLSDAGTSGFFLFRKHCQDCHGYLGSGTSKIPALLGSAYSTDHKARKAFHREFRHSSRDHIRVARGTRKKPGPRFNELELIGKFLREIDAWHTMLRENSLDG